MIYNALILFLFLATSTFAFSAAEAELRVVVSLTALPQRFEKLPKVLQSLDLKGVEGIHINLPREYKGTPYQIKGFAKQMRALLRVPVEVFSYEEDLGPIMKFLPTANRLFKKGNYQNTVVATVDDDTLYCLADAFVEKLVEINSFSQAERCAVNIARRNRDLTALKIKTFARLAFDQNSVFSPKMGIHPLDSSWKEQIIPHIVMGGLSVYYPLKLFTQQILDELMEISRLNESTRKSDDMVMGRVLAKHGIQSLNFEMAQQRMASRLPPATAHPFHYAECLMGARVDHDDGVPYPEERDRYNQADQTIANYYSAKEHKE